MAQPAFSAALLEAAASQGIDTAVETSGNGRKIDFLAAARWTRLWLWDIKLMDAMMYKEYTGGSLQTMLDNLETVAAEGESIRFRILYIPEIHDNQKIVTATKELLEKYPQAEKEVIPYHLLGNAKREKMGLPQVRFAEPSKGMAEVFSRKIGAGATPAAL